MEHVPGLLYKEVKAAFHEPPPLPVDLFDTDAGDAGANGETIRSSTTQDGKVIRESIPSFNVVADIPSAASFSGAPSIEVTELQNDDAISELDEPELPSYEIASVSPPPISGNRTIERTKVREYKNPVYQETSAWIKEFVKKDEFGKLGEDGNPLEFVYGLQAMHDAHAAALEYPSIEAEEEYAAVQAEVQKALDRKVYFSALDIEGRRRHEEAVKQLREIVEDAFICKLVTMTVNTRQAPSASIAAQQLARGFNEFKQEERDFISSIPAKAA